MFFTALSTNSRCRKLVKCYEYIEPMSGSSRIAAEVPISWFSNKRSISMLINFRVPKPPSRSLPKLAVSGYQHPTRSLLIYALADGTSTVRIYLPGELFPIHLRRFLRHHHLRVYKPAQHDAAEGRLISPALFSFHPISEVMLIIEPDKPTFYVKTATGEREVHRDERNGLVLS